MATNCENNAEAFSGEDEDAAGAGQTVGTEIVGVGCGVTSTPEVTLLLDVVPGSEASFEDTEDFGDTLRLRSFIFVSCEESQDQRNGPQLSRQATRQKGNPWTNTPKSDRSIREETVD